MIIHVKQDESSAQKEETHIHSNSTYSKARSDAAARPLSSYSTQRNDLAQHYMHVYIYVGSDASSIVL